MTEPHPRELYRGDFVVRWASTSRHRHRHRAGRLIGTDQLKCSSVDRARWLDPRAG